MGGLLLVSIYMLVDILVHRYVITEDALEVYRPWGKQRILWKDIAKVRWRDVKGTKYPYPVPVLVAANGWEILYPRANLLVDMPAAETERALFGMRLRGVRATSLWIWICLCRCARYLLSLMNFSVYGRAAMPARGYQLSKRRYEV